MPVFKLILQRTILKEVVVTAEDNEEAEELALEIADWSYHNSQTEHVVRLDDITTEEKE